MVTEDGKATGKATVDATRNDAEIIVSNAVALSRFHALY